MRRVLLVWRGACQSCKQAGGLRREREQEQAHRSSGPAHLVCASTLAPDVQMLPPHRLPEAPGTKESWVFRTFLPIPKLKVSSQTPVASGYPRAPTPLGQPAFGSLPARLWAFLWCLSTWKNSEAQLLMMLMSMTSRTQSVWSHMCSVATGWFWAKLLKMHRVAFLLIILTHTEPWVLEEMFNTTDNGKTGVGATTNRSSMKAVLCA